MYHGLPEDTLAAHDTRILGLHRSFADRPCSEVALVVARQLSPIASKINPDRAALEFYGLNHAVSVLRAKYGRFEPMDPRDAEDVKSYHNKSIVLACAMLSYLILICTRESRHLRDGVSDGHQAAKFAKVVATVDPQVMMFVGNNLGRSSEALVKAFTIHPPKATIGAYSRGLCAIFRNGGFDSSYGGLPWANIADCLARFVHGETSAEIMLDTMFTLQHNNGSCFNKDMNLERNSSALATILDVQRAGQIPEYILEKSGAGAFELWETIMSFHARHPDAWGSKVDWKRVYATQVKQSHAVTPLKENGEVKSSTKVQFKKYAAGGPVAALLFEVMPKSSSTPGEYLTMITPKSRQKKKI